MVRFWKGHFSSSSTKLSFSEVWNYLQRAVVNFDILGLTQGAVTNVGLLFALFRPPTTSGRGDHGHVPVKRPLPMGQRISRFIEERYLHRAQPDFLPELALLGIIVIVAIWPMLSLPAAMEQLK